MDLTVFYGLMIPFAGTALGSACVFFLKNGMGDRVQRGLTGFASGVMVAASIWSLLIPAMDQASGLGVWAFLPAAGGFWLGVLFLLLLDHAVLAFIGGQLQSHSDPSLWKFCPARRRAGRPQSRSARR